MHDSTKRLLEFARRATSSEARPVATFADIGRALNVSSATLTNWKSRGMSKEGAIAAEAKYGCSASWLLTGNGPSTKIAQHFAPREYPTNVPPPKPPADFADPHRDASESDWQLLDDLKWMPQEDRETLKAEVREKAAKWRKHTQEMIGQINKAKKPS